MDRRTFFKHMGLALGASAASACSRDTRYYGDGKPGSVTEWKKAPCRFCGVGCGVEVGLRDGRAVAVRGDQKSPVNKGLLCVKGYHLPAVLYGRDRLTEPLLRQPNGNYKSISWDEALDLIAAKYRETLDAHGPEAVGLYLSGQSTIYEGYAGAKWVKGGMRSNNLEANARLCMASAVMGFMTQFKSDEPMGCYDDLELGDDFFLWGNNMAEMHPVLFSRILENKRQRPNVRIVDLATRRTPTSHYADLYVEFRPGTDLALANGILHLLAKNDQFDRAFIEENVVFKEGIEDLQAIGYGCFGEQAERYGFKDKGKGSDLAAFIARLQDYTPARVSEITGVPTAQIESLAEMYGDRNRGAVSLWCMGVNQHVRGTWMNNLINDIHLLTAKISRPGSNPFSLTGQPSACGTVREVGTLNVRLPADMLVTVEAHRKKTEEIWGLEPGTINPKPGYHTMDMWRAFARGDLKVLWVQTTNPFQSIPNLHRIDRSFDDDRFLIVSDIYPTPTTEAADLILPSAAWVEKEGAFGNTERRTQLWEQMVEPPGQARDDAWQLIEVAKRMGYGDLFPWSDDDWHEPMWEEYRKFTVGVGKDVASYEQLHATRGLRWPVVDGVETRYRYAAGHDPYVKKAEGVHFYKATAYGEKAAVWFRPYHPPAEVPDDDYPFWLSHGSRAGTLAHRIHDSAREAVAPSRRQGLRGAQPRRRSPNGDQRRRSGQAHVPSRGPDPTGQDRRARTAPSGHGVRAVLR